MKIGQVMKCKDFNIEKLSEWHKACDKDTTGNKINNIGTYVWFNNKGNFKNYGYVGKIKEHSFIWCKTKKEVLEEFKLRGVV